MKTIGQSRENINEIVTALENGAVLVLPTDTVYGLVCDAGNQNAVEKIYKIKKRPKSKPLPVFVNDIEMAKQFAEISRKQEEIIKKSWPGAITFILKAKEAGLSPLVYRDGTIALRAPNYILIKEIFEELKKPLAQTSANISSEEPLRKIEDIIKTFGKQKNQPDLIIDAGDLPENKPSTIIDLTNKKTEILRK